MTTTTTHADAALIDLGNLFVAGMFAEVVAIAELEASGDIDDDAMLDAACQPLSQIIEQIKGLAPLSVAGLNTHRLVNEWLYGTLPADLQRLAAS